jgi:hypothetical protein
VALNPMHRLHLPCKPFHHCFIGSTPLYLGRDRCNK